MNNQTPGKWINLSDLTGLGKGLGIECKKKRIKTRSKGERRVNLKFPVAHQGMEGDNWEF